MNEAKLSQDKTLEVLRDNPQSKRGRVDGLVLTLFPASDGSAHGVLQGARGKMLGALTASETAVKEWAEAWAKRSNQNLRVDRL